MEDYPRPKGALLTVVAVEEPHLVVADADSVRYRVKYTPSRASQEAEPLKAGDVLIVNQVKPIKGLTVVERLTTMGRRDGSQYELFDDQLASTCEPASAIGGHGMTSWGSRTRMMRRFDRRRGFLNIPAWPLRSRVLLASLSRRGLPSCRPNGLRWSPTPPARP